MADPWESYAAHLGALSDARRLVERLTDEARQESAARARIVAYTDGQIAAQRERLDTLAADLHVILPPLAPTILPGGMTPDWEKAADEIDFRIKLAEEEIAEAQEIARLPKLLPGWESQQARNVFVYWLASLPFTLYIVATVIAPFLTITVWSYWEWWFIGIVVHPAIVAVGGTVAIHSVCRPKIPTEDFDPKPRPFMGALVAAGWWFLVWKILEAMS
jgi:hypothetical protein